MRGLFKTLVILSLLACAVTVAVTITQGLNLTGAVVLFAILPAAWLLDRLFGGPADNVEYPPQCSVCGYDLRASPDRCPECGTIAYKEPTFDE